MSAAVRFFSGQSTRRFLKSRVQTELSSSSPQHHRERKEYVVQITKRGFSVNALVVNEGETVTWKWSSYEGTTGHNVVQVVCSRTIEGLRIFDVTLTGSTLDVVKGGLSSGKVVGTGEYSYTFRCQGTYSFISQGFAKKRCVLTIAVQKRPAQTVRVSDDGFHPRTLRIDAATTVMFNWEACTLPRTVRLLNDTPKGDPEEVEGAVMMRDTSGSHQHVFEEPGEYCFTTEASLDGASRYLCIVSVQCTVKEWLVNVSDNGFSPALLEVSSEDRVWFVWDKKQCKKGQHIVQRTRNGSESGESGISRGSKKILLTRDGCYSQLFSTPGVIYFGSLGLPSSSICTVVVRSSLNSETVTFTEGGFEPEILAIRQGMQLSWTWDVTRLKFNFTICQPQSCVTGQETKAVRSSTAAVRASSVNLPTSDDSAEAEVWREIYGELGSSSLSMVDAGVFFFRTTGRDMDPWMMAIVDPFPQDHSVRITPHGFEPKELTIRPGDTVWWQWTESCQNVCQVDANGSHDPEVHFKSGDAMTAGSFVMSFGAVCEVFITSAGHADDKSLTSVIHVEPVKQVHSVLVDNHYIAPSMVLASPGDVLCFLWHDGIPCDAYAVTNALEAKLSVSHNPVPLVGSDCPTGAALRLDQPGVFHFVFKQKCSLLSRNLKNTVSATSLQPEFVSFDTPKANDCGCTLLTVIVEEKSPKAIEVLAKEIDGKGGNAVMISKVTGEPKKAPRLRTYSSAGTARGVNKLHNRVASSSVISALPDSSGIIPVWKPQKNACQMPAEPPTIQTISTSSINLAREKTVAVDPSPDCPSATIVYTTDFTIPVSGGSNTKVLQPGGSIDAPSNGLYCVRAIAVDGECVSKVVTSSLMTTKTAAAQLRNWLAGTIASYPQTLGCNGIAITGVTNNTKKNQDAPSPRITTEVAPDGHVIVRWPCVTWPEPRSPVRGYAVTVNGIVCCQIPQPDTIEKDGEAVLCQVEIKDLSAGSYILIVSAEEKLHDPPAPTGSKSPEVAVSIGEMSAGVLKTRHVSASSYDSALDTSFYNCSKPESARDANIYEALSILSEAKARKAGRTQRKRLDRSESGFYMAPMSVLIRERSSESSSSLSTSSLALFDMDKNSVTFTIDASDASNNLIIVGPEFNSENNSTMAVGNQMIKSYNANLFPTDPNMECLVWPVDKITTSLAVKGCLPGVSYLAVLASGDSFSNVLAVSPPSGNVPFWIKAVNEISVKLQWSLTAGLPKIKELVLTVDTKPVKYSLPPDSSKLEVHGFASGKRHTMQLICNCSSKLSLYSNLVTVNTHAPCEPMVPPRVSCRTAQFMRLNWPGLQLREDYRTSASSTLAKIDEYRVFVDGKLHTAMLRTDAKSTEAQSVSDINTSSRHRVAYFVEGSNIIEASVPDIVREKTYLVEVQPMFHSRLRQSETSGLATECWLGSTLPVSLPRLVDRKTSLCGPELELVKVAQHSIHISWEKQSDSHTLPTHALYDSNSGQLMVSWEDNDVHPKGVVDHYLVLHCIRERKESVNDSSFLRQGGLPGREWVSIECSATCKSCGIPDVRKGIRYYVAVVAVVNISDFPPDSVVDSPKSSPTSCTSHTFHVWSEIVDVLVPAANTAPLQSKPAAGNVEDTSSPTANFDEDIAHSLESIALPATVPHLSDSTVHDLSEATPLCATSNTDLAVVSPTSSNSERILSEATPRSADESYHTHATPPGSNNKCPVLEATPPSDDESFASKATQSERINTSLLLEATPPSDDESFASEATQPECINKSPVLEATPPSDDENYLSKASSLVSTCETDLVCELDSLPHPSASLIGMTPLGMDDDFDLPVPLAAPPVQSPLADDSHQDDSAELLSSELPAADSGTNTSDKTAAIEKKQSRVSMKTRVLAMSFSKTSLGSMTDSQGPRSLLGGADSPLSNSVCSVISNGELQGSSLAQSARCSPLTVTEFGRNSVSLAWSGAEAPADMINRDLVVESEGTCLHRILKSDSSRNCIFSVDVDWSHPMSICVRPQEDKPNMPMSFFIPLPGRDPSGISFEQLAATYCEKGGMQDDVVKVTWVLTTPAADCLERIDVIWKETHDAERTNRVSVPKTATEYNIQSVEAKTIYEIFLEAVMDNDEETTVPSIGITCKVPGPPAAPVLTIDSHTSEMLVVSWKAVKSCSEVEVTGFRLCVNGVESENIIPASATSTQIPIDPVKCYVISMAALTNHSRWTRSPESGGLFADLLKSAPTSTVAQASASVSSATSATSSVSLQVVASTPTSISLSWSDATLLLGDHLSHYIVRWNTFKDPKIHNIKLSPKYHSYNLLGLDAATTHSIRVLAHNDIGHVLCRSRQKQIDTPDHIVSIVSEPLMYDTLRQLSIEEDKEASFFLMPEPKAEVRPSVQSCGELQFVSKSGGLLLQSLFAARNESEEAAIDLSLQVSSSKGVGRVQAYINTVAQCYDQLLARKLSLTWVNPTKPSEVRKKQSEALYNKTALERLAVEMTRYMSFIADPKNVQGLGFEFILTWAIPEGVDRSAVTGFQLMLDNQPSGDRLPVTATETRLEVTDPSYLYKLTVCGVSDDGDVQLTSNVWNLRPMECVHVRYFCMMNSHIKGAKYPEQGCCSYLESLEVEAKVLGEDRLPCGFLIDMEKLEGGVFLESCPVNKSISNVHVLDIKENVQIPLVDPQMPDDLIQVILFWSDWCVTSQQMLRLFQNYATQHSSKALSFVHCCVGCTHIAVDDMRKHHTDAGFLGCSSTKGVCGCHVLRAGRLLPTKVFDVVGVPTLSVVYKQVVVWQGHSSGNTLEDFSSLMSHVLGRIRGVPCTVQECGQCAPCESSLPKALQNELDRLHDNSVRKVARPTIRRSQRGSSRIRM